MAGAGKKTFVAGEVLTAAQVNDYLMDQAVMRFSGSAARAASLTAPTEGMVTYLDDTNSLEYYDGAAWNPVVTTTDYAAKGQILVASAAAQPVPVTIGAEGQVLTAASAAPTGVEWRTPEGAGAAIFKTIAATGTTVLPADLPPGFYRISTGNTNSWTQEQFRFVDQYGSFYGASITSGLGFATIPVTVASFNVTASAGFNLLVEELPGVTATLPDGPTMTSAGWTSPTLASLAFTTGITPSRVGYFNPLTGSLVTSSVVTSPFSNASLAASTTPFDSNVRFAFVQQNADGLWSVSGSTWGMSDLGAPYPYAVFTANGTYTPPSWSSTVDAFIVSAGGAGGGRTTGNGGGGGGGAGGASLFTNIATPGSVAVTVGVGGTGGTSTGPSGGASSFGSASVAGGGGGGGFNAPAAPGASGGSGGGGGGRISPESTGTGGAASPSGLGFAGGNGHASGPNLRASGGGGGGYAAAGTNGAFGQTSPGGSGSVYLVYPFGGGGGGGADQLNNNTPLGGSGGGGNGQYSMTAGGQPSGPAATPGTANTGGGGGGSTTATAAGNGGTGIVIVRAK